jgi:hypothetical protein
VGQLLVIRTVTSSPRGEGSDKDMGC